MATHVHSLYETEVSSLSWPSHVENHEQAPLSLTDACCVSGMSPSSVGRMFVRYLGMTPERSIFKTKMDCAQSLLWTTRLPVSGIGAGMGLEDVANCSKKSRQYAGIGPPMYRHREAVILYQGAAIRWFR
jgi:transcriptional regulator GlxA family with amidase domain